MNLFSVFYVFKLLVWLYVFVCFDVCCCCFLCCLHLCVVQLLCSVCLLFVGLFGSLYIYIYSYVCVCRCL